MNKHAFFLIIKISLESVTHKKDIKVICVQNVQKDSGAVKVS